MTTCTKCGADKLPDCCDGFIDDRLCGNYIRALREVVSPVASVPVKYRALNQKSRPARGGSARRYESDYSTYAISRAVNQKWPPGFP
jgi:hypothetical protein